jgi:crotonobetainyl-CoA:carnitine CoA-transferase CaiB-like acyl-CoA transferase
VTTAAKTEGRSYLEGARVLEVADELGEYCGKLLAGLGADVVKVEAPEGEQTRSYGPFYQDVPHRDRSLYFWHYNHAKRGVTIDLDSPSGQKRFRVLAATAAIVIDSKPRGYMDERGIGYEALKAINPGLIYVRISPFGDDGPWADLLGSDLIHLALGGMVMNCGYDPEPSGEYDTPPVAPQMWQSYQLVGEMAVISILGSMYYRLKTGLGQKLETNVHAAVSQNTETDVPDWVFLGQTHRRLTCRHSMLSSAGTGSALAATKDGRYLLPYRTYLKGTTDPWEGTVRLLAKYGMQRDLEDPRYEGDAHLEPAAVFHMGSVVDRLVNSYLYSKDLWRDAQLEALPWAPVRRPEENADDSHWRARGSVMDVEHPELGRSFTYVGSRWYSTDADWTLSRRAPLLGEHDGEVDNDWAAPVVHELVHGNPRTGNEELTSRLGKPFALSDIRVVDLSWMLASAGAGRFLASMGAEVIKVEHESRWDSMRFSLGKCPPGGRAERDAATSPLPTPVSDSPNRGGAFMEINAGKLSMALNLKTAEGKKILEELIRDADMVIEGFSPGTMERMGFGYARLRELNPDIIYVQQSGFGQYGTYGNMRAFGPTAQAQTGLSDMSGLPEPYPPAGIGYSYLDWFGAYNMANAMLAALYRRAISGKGCHIDASQGDTGVYLVGTTILDNSANERRWSRYGNRSPYKQAAPHGVYRTQGDDRWIAIASFTDAQWDALRSILELGEWADGERFGTLEARLAHQDDLDRHMDAATKAWAPFELQARLQEAGVPAGVCQTAQDRYESDPQLEHLEWLVELDQTEIGRWPVKVHPVWPTSRRRTSAAGSTARAPTTQRTPSTCCASCSTGTTRR